MSEFMLDVAIKAQQWEIAKGHLRALVALQGSYQSHAGKLARWLALEKATEEFIEHVEGEGLQE